MLSYLMFSLPQCFQYSVKMSVEINVAVKKGLETVEWFVFCYFRETMLIGYAYEEQ